jgi:type IV pilus assembly protein PilV
MQRNDQQTQWQHTIKGFSMVEALVALLVLSIGLLGLAALQTTSLKYNTESYWRTQATYLANDIIDRMRANKSGVNNGNYTVATTAAASAALAATKPCGTASCSTSDLAIYDLGQWYTGMKTALPGSTLPTGHLATISRDAVNTSLYTITINWTERDVTQTQTWIVQFPL